MEQLVMPVANDVWAINAGFIIGLHEPGPTGNPFPIGKGVGGVLDGQFSMPAVQNVYLAKIRFPPAEVEGFEDLGRAFIIQRPELRDLQTLYLPFKNSLYFESSPSLWIYTANESGKRNVSASFADMPIPRQPARSREMGRALNGQNTPKPP